jgi:hypothetical protein
MNMDEYIDRPIGKPAPVTRHAAMRRAWLGLGAAMILSLALVIALLGLGPDLATAIEGSIFWMKLAFTGSLALVALAALPTLSQPELAPPRLLWCIPVPVAIIAVIVIAEAMIVSRALWLERWLGISWQSCPLLIAMLAMPMSVVIALALRQFAPTRLRLTGDVAGLAAGALSATFYCLHCPESGPAFVLTWYSLGILVVDGAKTFAVVTVTERAITPYKWVRR